MTKVSLCIVSYNRKKLLEQCINSFLKTNLYDNIEVVLIDNGSTNHEFINYTKNLGSLLSEYNIDYLYHRIEKNDYPVGLKKARNLVRNLSTGDFFIDCPDDHLFVVRSNWIKECINFIEASNDVGCIAHYAYPAYRFLKPNNKMDKSPQGDYFKSILKGYADYHIMSRSTYKSLGPFKHELGIKCEGEYMKRALDAGYHRYLMAKPVAIINPGKQDVGFVTEGKYDIIKPASAPVSNEQLTEFIMSVE